MQVLLYLVGSTDVKLETPSKMSICIILHAQPKLAISHFYSAFLVI